MAEQTHKVPPQNWVGPNHFANELQHGPIMMIIPCSLSNITVFQDCWGCRWVASEDILKLVWPSEFFDTKKSNPMCDMTLPIRSKHVPFWWPDKCVTWGIVGNKGLASLDELKSLPNKDEVVFLLNPYGLSNGIPVIPETHMGDFVQEAMKFFHTAQEVTKTS